MVFQQAFHVMRSGRPGPVLIDLPIDVQLAEIEFDDETYEPLPAYRPKARPTSWSSSPSSPAFRSSRP